MALTWVTVALRVRVTRTTVVVHGVTVTAAVRAIAMSNNHLLLTDSDSVPGVDSIDAES